MQLNSHQTKTELKRLARFPAIKNNTRIYSAGSCPWPLTGACVHGLSGQQKGKERKEGRKEGSVTVDVSGLRVFVLILPITKQIPHSR